MSCAKWSVVMKMADSGAPEPLTLPERVGYRAVGALLGLPLIEVLEVVQA